MHLLALVIALAGCVAIAALGLRFLLSPGSATAAFGVAPGTVRALTAIKGVRDVASGVVLLVVWAAAGTEALGWALLVATLTPLGDATIVLANGGTRSAAVGIHGVTALVLIAAGLVLALG